MLNYRIVSRYNAVDHSIVRFYFYILYWNWYYPNKYRIVGYEHHKKDEKLEIMFPRLE